MSKRQWKLRWIRQNFAVCGWSNKMILAKYNDAAKRALYESSRV